VAAAVSFLVSDDAGYITGNVININGGLHCWYENEGHDNATETQIYTE
jgi:NAD(P)-dependent dehydrogenase (short-subunit alcohol dehydrogenase family)